jgi:hypothetical protein
MQSKANFARRVLNRQEEYSTSAVCPQVGGASGRWPEKYKAKPISRRARLKNVAAQPPGMAYTDRFLYAK